jgi:lysophospholipase L1-like esterase
MLPIWASGLSSWRAIVYSALFVALTYLANFAKLRLSTSIAGLCALVFGSFLLVIERATFINLPVRIIIIVWLVLVMLIVSNQKVRNVVAANILVLGVLLLFIEIPFRVLTNSQSSSKFQYIEVFRHSRNDGPDAGSEPVTTNSLGFRTTTDQPSTSSGRVLIFGGSTTFCGEVSDRLTYPSQLQRILNDRNSGLIVENYGKSAATATDRVQVLKSIDDLDNNDIVIFYVGVNESGVGFVQRDLPVGLITKLPELGNALRKVSKYSRIADILFRKFVFGAIEISEGSKLKAEAEFRKAMQDAESFATKSGAKFVPVLQANLFTRNPPSDYDQTLAKMYGSELGVVMPDMYERLLPIISAYENFGDARAVMDNLERSPYYDWMHIDSRGNLRIATFLNDLLLAKKLIK